MSERDSGFKQILEFLSNTKTVIELLAALGAGKLLQAALISLTKVPPQWVTPLWLLCAALFLWLISFVTERIAGHKRNSPEPEQLQESQRAVQLASTGDSAEIDAFWRSYDNDLLVEVESRIRAMVVGCQSSTEREKMLIRYVATRELINYFDRVWNGILFSQLEALDALNPAPLRSEALELYYSSAALVYPAEYATFPFEAWLAYPLNEELISAEAGGVYRITVMGREFLKYLISNGKSRMNKKF